MGMNVPSAKVKEALESLDLARVKFQVLIFLINAAFDIHFTGNCPICNAR